MKYLPLTTKSPPLATFLHTWYKKIHVGLKEYAYRHIPSVLHGSNAQFHFGCISADLPAYTPPPGYRITQKIKGLIYASLHLHVTLLPAPYAYSQTIRRQVLHTLPKLTYKTIYCRKCSMFYQYGQYFRKVRITSGFVNYFAVDRLSFRQGCTSEAGYLFLSCLKIPSPGRHSPSFGAE